LGKGGRKIDRGEVVTTGRKLTLFGKAVLIGKTELTKKKVGEWNKEGFEFNGRRRAKNGIVCESSLF